MPRTRSLAWSELKIGIVSLFAIGIAVYGGRRFLTAKGRDRD